MRKSASIIALVAIPVTSLALADVPRSVDTTQKSSQDLASCIVLSLSETRGYEIAKSANGEVVTIALRYRIIGVAATAATFEIVDAGAERRLSIYATGKASGAPRVFAERARKACL